MTLVAVLAVGFLFVPVAHAAPSGGFFSDLFGAMFRRSAKQVVQETPWDAARAVRSEDLAIAKLPKSERDLVINATSKEAQAAIPDTLSRDDVFFPLMTCLNEKVRRFCLVVGDSPDDVHNAIYDIANRIARNNGAQVPPEFRQKTVAIVNIRDLVSKYIRQPANPTTGEVGSMTTVFNDILERLEKNAQNQLKNNKPNNVIFAIPDYDALLSPISPGLESAFTTMRRELENFQASYPDSVIIGAQRSTLNRDLGLAQRGAKDVPLATRAGMTPVATKFELVDIKPSTPEQAFAILQLNKAWLAQEVGVPDISENAMKTAIKLARPNEDGALPYGAINILRKAAAQKRFRSYRPPRRVAFLDLSISSLQKELSNLEQQAYSGGDFFPKRLAALRDMLAKQQQERTNVMNLHDSAIGALESLEKATADRANIQAQLDQTKNPQKIKEILNEVLPPVDSHIAELRRQLQDLDPESSGVSENLEEADVLASEANRRGVSAESLRAAYGSIREQIPPNIGKLLRAAIKGNNDWVDMIATDLERARDGGYTEGLPVTKWMMFGPPGTGKSEGMYALARILEEYNDPAAAVITRQTGRKPSNLLVISGGEFNDPTKMNTLTGSPPGYVGSDQTYELETWGKKPGIKLALVDEIEKSGKPFLPQWLLTCLEKPGELTLAKGEKISCGGTIWAVVGNAIQYEFKDELDRISQLPPDQQAAEREVLVEQVKKWLVVNRSDVFPDEAFANRFGSNIFLTRPLGHDEFIGIAQNFVRDLQYQLNPDFYGIQLTDAALERLSEAGDARKMRDVFTKFITAPVNKIVRDGKVLFNRSGHMLPQDPNVIVPGDTIVVDFNGQNFTFKPASRTPVE